MKKIIALIMIAGLITGIAGLFSENRISPFETENITGGKNYPANSIGVIELDGAISYESYGYFEKSSTAGKLIRDFKFFTSSKVKAVVLRINSPGGTIGAVQEICYAMEDYRKSGGKIVASFKDISASGGYYISCYADRIVANPGTLTGSIGVIMSMPNLAGLFEKLGIKYNTIKSGQYKDIGNMARDMSEAEFDLLQGTVDDSYEQFVEAVVEGRKLDREKVGKIADGRIFTGRQAKEIGLVDELGGMDKAVETAKSLSGIKGDHILVYAENRKNIMDILNDLN